MVTYTLNPTHYKLYTVYWILYTKHYTLHTVHCILFFTNYPLHTAHYTLYIVNYTLHTAHFDLYTVQYKLPATPYALYTVQCKFLPTHHTLTYCTLYTAHLLCFDLSHLGDCQGPNHVSCLYTHISLHRSRTNILKSSKIAKLWFFGTLSKKLKKFNPSESNMNAVAFFAMA